MGIFSHTLRRLGRSPMFTTTSVLTLAIGIGANTSIFSVVNGVLLKPLPYPDADRLAGVWQTAPALNIRDLYASPATYFTYREEGRTFEDIGLSAAGFGQRHRNCTARTSAGADGHRWDTADPWCEARPWTLVFKTG